jgi:hypothetical protein
MFFCEPCREQRQWPESMSKSRGTCEICKVYAYCNDVPSGILADWEAIEKRLEQPLELF